MPIINKTFKLMLYLELSIGLVPQIYDFITCRFKSPKSYPLRASSSFFMALMPCTSLFSIFVLHVTVNACAFLSAALVYGV